MCDDGLPGGNIAVSGQHEPFMFLVYTRLSRSFRSGKSFWTTRFETLSRLSFRLVSFLQHYCRSLCLCFETLPVSDNDHEPNCIISLNLYSKNAFTAPSQLTRRK